MKVLLFFTAICFVSGVSAQLVSETVNFDNYISISDNDFENRFDNGPGLTQIQTNGITGGCLQTPQTINWGNDNALYCTRFKGDTNVINIIGICFKYDTSQFNNINFDRPVSLWMIPSADPNHYIIASVLDSRKLQIVTYSVANTSNAINLEQGHWYNLFLIADFDGDVTGDEIEIQVLVYDLGITGTDSPITVGNTSAILHDSTMISDPSIEVTISGTSWGGAQYVDNFTFDGMKSSGNCISTAVDEPAENIQSYVNGSVLTVQTGNIQNGIIEIFDVQGRKVGEKKMTSEITTFEINGLPPGIYFLSIENEKHLLTRKFILQ